MKTFLHIRVPKKLNRLMGRYYASGNIKKQNKIIDRDALPPVGIIIEQISRVRNIGNIKIYFVSLFFLNVMKVFIVHNVYYNIYL